MNCFYIRGRLGVTLLLAAFLGIISILSLPQLLAWQRQQTPIAPSVPIPSHFFGMTVNHWQSVPWPEIAFGSLRTWDTGVVWANINRAPGVYDWSKFESLIGLAESHGIDVVFVFGHTPRWASAKPDAPTPYGPGLCASPSKIEYWDDFVRAIVTRAHGRIRYWEIWNEPQDKEFYCSDIATMVELQEHAYKIIKLLDPKSIVLTPSPVGKRGLKWMSDFLANGGGQYADIMAFHGYSTSTDAESIVSVTNKFRDVFSANGQTSKPIWDTESSWGETARFSDPDSQAAFLARYYLLHWSEGVGRFYWYSYDNKISGGLWDEIDGLHKSAIAYKQVYKWMVDARMNTSCDVHWFTRIWTCGFSRPNGYQAIAVWHSGNSVSFLPPTQYKQYRDLDGNISQITGKISIGDKPILIETKTAF